MVIELRFFKKKNNNKKKMKNMGKNVKCTFVIVISPLRVLYPDLQTRLTRARSARVGVSVNGYCTIRGVIIDL